MGRFRRKLAQGVEPDQEMWVDPKDGQIWYATSAFDELAIDTEFKRNQHFPDGDRPEVEMVRRVDVLFDDGIRAGDTFIPVGDKIWIKRGG